MGWREAVSPGSSVKRMPPGLDEKVRSHATTFAGESALADPTMRRFTLNQDTIPFASWRL